MEVALIGAAVGATIKVLLDKPVTFSTNEITQAWGFKKDLKKLNESFLMIKDVISDAEAQQMDKRAVLRWLYNLESVAFETDAVFDEFNYQLLKKKVNNQMENKVTRFFCFFSLSSHSIHFRFKMSHRINDINKNLEEISKTATSFGLQMQSARAHLRRPVVQETNSKTADPIVVGREDDVSIIVEMLVSPAKDEDFLIIPIVGMGGLGKTTLAREVFKHETIRDRFGKRVWVYVSQEFSEGTLYKRILEGLTLESVQIESAEAIVELLQKNLDGERFLLVLDDMWMSEKPVWENFVKTLTAIKSFQHNGIIVTTRKGETASMVETLPSYSLSGLSWENCWSIIKEKALKGVYVSADLEETGKDIARKCDGLPLAAQLIGVLLKDEPTEEQLSLIETQLSTLVGENITKILKLSFDHLSSPSLKKCFVYCSIFPQDFEIDRELIIELWMAEGFLEADQRKDMESCGNDFFNKLLQNSLFQNAKKDNYGKIISCQMHDLVHDLASSISGSNSIQREDISGDKMQQARYVSLNSVQHKECEISHDGAKYFRTLFFKGTVVESIFSNFTRLHVLKLQHADVNELPASIGKLKYLRFLEVWDTPLKCLPTSIGKLYNLQTLRTNNLKELPNTLTSLINLRHLHIPFIDLPPGMGKLFGLRTLENYPVGHKKGCGIGELGGMKSLTGVISVQNLERVKGKEDAEQAKFFEKKNVDKLKLMWRDGREGEVNDEEVLEGLKPHPDLKSLELYGYRGRSLTSWTMKMAVQDDGNGRELQFKKLMHVRLTNCECDEIPMFGHLSKLKCLQLIGLPNVKCIGPSFYGIANSGLSSMTNNVNLPFPALERLELFDMPNLIQWRGAQAATSNFPLLKNLDIRDCIQLRSAPGNFARLKSLSCVRLGINFPFGSVCCSKESSLEQLDIWECQDVISLPDELFLKNQNLASLIIRSCKSLRNFPSCLHNLHSLRNLEVWGCPELKSIHNESGQSQCHNSLVELTIKNCPELTSFPTQILESCTSTLKALRIEGLENLMNPDELISSLQRMKCLTQLGIYHIPKVLKMPIEISSLTILRRLRIGGFSDTLDEVTYNEGLNGILQQLHSLSSLELYGKNYLNSLPDQLMHLKNLRDLTLRDYGIKVLPEQFGNLSSLAQLYIFDCKDLQHLPFKETMQRLTKLKTLYFEGCSLLKFSEGDDDSEWPKISHIKDFFVC